MSKKDDKKFSLKGRLQGAVDSVKSAAEKVDFNSAKEKLKEAGDSAKESIKKVKLPEVDASKIKDAFKKEDRHTLVQLNGSSIRILLPDGYDRLKQKNPLKEASRSIANTETAYRKTVSTSDNIVMIFKGEPDKAMNPDDVKGLINGIHENLSDNQGIIEVKNGTTKRGYKYIYSIVKNLSEVQFGGVRYFLRLNLFNENDIVEIQADFTEINMTGQREALCLEFARRAGLIEIGEEGLKGWTQDPYDPEYKKGCLMNLAEKEGLDGLFPENPLTQCREFLLAVLQDEFVSVRKEEKEEDAQKSDKQEELSPEEKASNEKEMMLGLFVDECRRYTYPVVIDAKKEKEEKIKAGKEGLNPKESKADETALNITAISTRNAIKIIYYLMAADGEIFHSEEEKFDSIGQELDPKFKENKDKIVAECQKQLDKVIDPEDYYDALQDGVEEALLTSRTTEDTFITPKLLVWDLLTIAYSDESYDETERKLLKYIVRKTNIDKAVFLEMESSILTLMDIEKELSWIKTTNKPYLTIEAMVNELADRKNVIFESVKDLISL